MQVIDIDGNMARELLQICRICMVDEIYCYLTLKAG